MWKRSSPGFRRREDESAGWPRDDLDLRDHETLYADFASLRNRTPRMVACWTDEKDAAVDSLR